MHLITRVYDSRLPNNTIYRHKAASPLWVSWPASDRLEDADLPETAVEQVEQAHTEGSEHVKHFAHKVATCRDNM